MNIYYYVTSPESLVPVDLTSEVDNMDHVIYIKMSKNTIKRSGVISDPDKILDLYNGVEPDDSDFSDTVKDYFTDSQEFVIEHAGILSSMDKNTCLKHIRKLYKATIKLVVVGSKAHTDLSNAYDLGDEFYQMGAIPFNDEDVHNAEAPPAGSNEEEDNERIDENDNDEKIDGNDDDEIEDGEDIDNEERVLIGKSNKRGADEILVDAEGGGSKKSRKSGKDSTNKTEDDVINMIQLMGKATEYEGFSAEKIRLKMINNAKTSFVLYKTLGIAFVAYARVGNNVGKLAKKRTDIKMSLELVNSISEMGVVMKADKSDSLTLPRLAIAFMPEYLAFRKSGLIRLESQTGVTLDVEYQDLCFAGCDSINNKKGYPDYYDDFSRKISNGGKGVVDDEKEEKKFKVDLKKWKDVSEKGYRNDPKVMNRMVKADTINGKESFEGFIKEAFDYYLKKV